MGRSRLAVLTALALSLAGRAGAAEITNVASRGGPGKAFDLRVTLRWDRTQERAQIEREVPSPPSAENPAGGAMGDELRYTRTENRVVPRVALALAEDLEVHFEWPYVLGDDRTWRFGLPPSGVPTGGTPPTLSTIELNDITADGAPCTGVDAFPGIAGVQCPLFPVAPQQTIFHGGRAGDLKGGIAWGIFDDKEDPTKPFWLVGLDITFPTASRYDPAIGRSADWVSASSAPGHPAPVGEKVWKWDFQTVLSRRLGSMDPYVKGHVMFLTKSSSTYSNCEHATELAAIGQMRSSAPAGCQAQGTKAGAQLPWIAGITVGTELVPYENEQEQQRVAIDFRLFGDYTSSSRFYNELTDMNGKLNWTEDYLTAGGLLGLYLRASRYVTLQASASVSTSTAHWLTGESYETGANPNFDARYDAPGRRFRISEVANFAMSFAGVLTF